MRTRRILAAVVVAVALVGAACSSSSAPETTTTTFDFPALEFGRGELPPSMPKPWPLPGEAVIGATMMDGSRMLTEVVITFPADVPAVAQYYQTNLDTLGYEITSASGSDGDFEIEFEGNGVTGTIGLEAKGTGLTAGTIQIFHG